VEIVANQSEFEYQQARGVLVGFRLPGFVAGVNVPDIICIFFRKAGTKEGICSVPG
jgi:alpha-acetolactate decarboxylase